MAIAVFSLFLITFCIGTTEFLVAGILPQLADDLGISVPAAGLVVTVYALGVAIGGPILTIVTARFPRKTTILALMVVFVAGHALAAVATNLPVLLVARAMTGMAHGCLFGLALVVAVGLVPDSVRGRALALVMAGVTIANIVGVPLGTLIGTAFTWRVAFWLLGSVATLAAIAVAVAVPASGGGERSAVAFRTQFTALLNAKVLTGFGLVFLSALTLWTTHTFISPILVDVAGIPPAAVAGVLLLFGGGATLGIFAGGWLADRAPNRTILLSFPVLVVLYVGLLLIRDGTLFAIVLFLVGIALCILHPPAQNRVLLGAAASPDLASTLISSIFNLGVALGAAIGSGVLSLGVDYALLPIVSLATAVLGTGLAVYALAGDRRVPAAA